MTATRSINLLRRSKSSHGLPTFEDEIKQIELETRKVITLSEMVSLRHEHGMKQVVGPLDRDVALSQLNDTVKSALKTTTPLNNRLQLLLSHSELDDDERERRFEMLQRKLLMLLSAIDHIRIALERMVAGIRKHETEMVRCIAKLIMTTDGKSNLTERVATDIAESGQAGAYLIFLRMVRGLPEEGVRVRENEVQLIEDRIAELRMIQRHFSKTSLTMEPVDDAAVEVEDRLDIIGSQLAAPSDKLCKRFCPDQSLQKKRTRISLLATVACSFAFFLVSVYISLFARSSRTTAS